MAERPLPFSVQVAADCGGEKVNLRFTFDRVPSLRHLLRDIDTAFSTLYAQQRPHHSIFAIGAAVVFNDARCTWDRLEHSSQLYPTAQVYIFQPNLQDSPSELPNAVDATPFLSRPEQADRRTPHRPTIAEEATARAATPSRRLWTAPKLVIQYANSASVTAHPRPPPPARKPYREYVPGSERLLQLEEKYHPQRVGADAEGSSKGPPKRFSVPPIDANEGNGSATPHHPYNDLPEQPREQPLLTDATEGAGPVRPTPPRSRRSTPRPRLVSPQRSDGGSDSPAREEVRSYANSTSWDRYWRQSSYTPDGTLRGGTDSAPWVTEVIRPSGSGSTSPSRGRISVLSISREGYDSTNKKNSGRAFHTAPTRSDALSSPRQLSPQPQPTTIAFSIREERAKLNERMHMPLDELRQALRQERQEMERSLSAHRADSGETCSPA